MGAEPTPPEIQATLRFAGRSEFQQLLRDMLGSAAQQGWNELMVSDPTFADWPLGEREVCEALQAWAKTGRRFTMLATRYDELVRRHARFVSWRRTWDHIIECWVCSKAELSEFPSAVWTPTQALIRIDAQHCVGVHTRAAARRTQLRETLMDWQGRGTLGFPASVLGL